MLRAIGESVIRHRDGVAVKHCLDPKPIDIIGFNQS